MTAQTQTIANHYEATLCTDCYLVGHHAFEDDLSKFNEFGIEYMSVLFPYFSISVAEDYDIEDFGKYPCDGCETRLHGARYTVIVNH